MTLVEGKESSGGSCEGNLILWTESDMHYLCYHSLTRRSHKASFKHQGAKMFGACVHRTHLTPFGGSDWAKFKSWTALGKDL